jgi:hypothetical protein
MPYTVVEEKLKAIPEQFLPEVSEFLDYVQYKAKITSPSQKRMPGVMKGKIRISDDFDAPLEEFKEYQ